MTPLERWSDDRLDDLNREVERMAEKVARISVIEEIATRGAKDAETCRVRVHKLANDQAAAIVALRNDLAAKAAADVKDRKTDRHWLIGAWLATASLIVAAASILAGHL